VAPFFSQLHFFIRTRGSFIAQNLRKKLKTIQPQQKNKVSNFEFKLVNKTAASAAQLAKCILLHVYSCTTACSQLRKNRQKLHIAY